MKGVTEFSTKANMVTTVHSSYIATHTDPDCPLQWESPEWKEAVVLVETHHIQYGL